MAISQENQGTFEPHSQDKNAKTSTPITKTDGKQNLKFSIVFVNHQELHTLNAKLNPNFHSATTTALNAKP